MADDWDAGRFIRLWLFNLTPNRKYFMNQNLLVIQFFRHTTNSTISRQKLANQTKKSKPKQK